MNANKRVRLAISGICGFLSGVLLTYAPFIQVQAQTANSFFFSQSAISVNPKAVATLKVNAGTNPVNFAGAAVKIDITKVQVDPATPLVYPLVINKTLFVAIPATDAAHINCAPASTVTGCTDGVIKFALAKCPAAAVTTSTQHLEGCYGISNTAQTGTFDLITIPLVSVNNTATTTTSLGFDSAGGNELVKDGTNPPTDITPFTNTPSTLTLWIRGDSNGDGVKASDLVPWKNNFGNPATTGAVAGDFNGDGFTRASDLVIWKANFGRPITP